MGIESLFSVYLFSSVSVVNYLPVDNLRRLIHTAFKKVKVKKK